jgi:hypothetical protein
MQQTPEEEIERRKITALIDEKERFISNVRKSIGVAQKPLEVYNVNFIIVQEVIRLGMNSVFAPSQQLLIHENFLLNEKTMDTYLGNLTDHRLILLEILENLVVRLIPYMSKINQNKDFATGLLLEELNVKEFDKPHNVNFNNLVNSTDCCT